MEATEELGSRDLDLRHNWGEYQKRNGCTLLQIKKAAKTIQNYKEKEYIVRNPRSLSEDQARVMTSIQTLLKEKRDMGFMAMITSSPGNGKSYLIEEIYNYAMSQEINVVITCPTGMSCTVFERAQTIHSLFGIRIGNRLEDALSDVLTNTTIERLRKIDMLVIDECYLVPLHIFCIMDIKLREAFNINKPFADRMVILSGDPSQNVAVGGVPLYHPFELDNELCERARNIYLSIKYVFSLDQNHRQKGEQTFLSILESIKENRFSEKDLSSINSRHITNLSQEERQSFTNAAFLSFTRQSVKLRNE